MRYLLHVEATFAGGGGGGGRHADSTLLVPLIVHLHHDDSAVLALAGEELLADLTSILRDHRGSIIPTVAGESGGALPASLGQQMDLVSIYHGSLISVQFSVRAAEACGEYSVLAFEDVLGEGGGGGSGAAAQHSRALSHHPSRTATFSLLATVRHKEREVARKRAAVLGGSARAAADKHA